MSQSGTIKRISENFISKSKTVFCALDHSSRENDFFCGWVKTGKLFTSRQKQIEIRQTLSILINLEKNENNRFNQKIKAAKWSVH